MCLNPRKIHNPSKTVGLQGGSRFDMEVPCGQCAECLKHKQDAWYFRAYYEAQSTFDNGGYILFDTLTYDNENLPHLNDFLSDDAQLSYSDNMHCFNVEHYRLFMVRLRRSLEYHGFNPSKNLKYFLTSEYGDDDRYTHRPHYHVLFYVTDPSLDPIELSNMIDKCWQMGRTDGAPYKGSYYVLAKRVFGYKYNCDRVHMQMVCNYVAKYVAKDSSYSKSVVKRFDKLFESHFGLHWRDNDRSGKGDEVYKELLKQVAQFYRASNGFGEDFLKYNDLDDILETGMIKMPDKKNIVKHTPLPTYYTYKLFYNLSKDAHGCLHWSLNDLGKDYKVKRAQKTVDFLTDRFNDWLINMGQFNYYHDGNDKEWYTQKLERFLELNRGRDIRQFAEYLVYYKGRIKSPQQLEREKKGIFICDDAEQFIRKGMETPSASTMYYYGTKADKNVFGEKFFTDKWLGCADEWRNNGLPYDYYMWNRVRRIAEANWNLKYSVTDDCIAYNIADKIGDYCSVRRFKYWKVIDDRCDDRFMYYDWMWQIYCDTQIEKNEFKQNAYNEKLELKKRLKSNGIYVSNL